MLHPYLASMHRTVRTKNRNGNFLTPGQGSWYPEWQSKMRWNSGARAVSDPQPKGVLFSSLALIWNVLYLGPGRGILQLLLFCVWFWGSNPRPIHARQALNHWAIPLAVVEDFYMIRTILIPDHLWGISVLRPGCHLEREWAQYQPPGAFLNLTLWKDCDRLSILTHSPVGTWWCSFLCTPGQRWPIIGVS